MEIHSEEVFNACSLFLARLHWCIFFFSPQEDTDGLINGERHFLDSCRKILQVHYLLWLPSCWKIARLTQSVDTAPLWNSQSTSIPLLIMNLIMFFFCCVYSKALDVSHTRQQCYLIISACRRVGVVKDKLSSNLCDFGTVSPEIHRTEPLSHKQARVIIDSLHGGALIKITFLVTVQASHRL